MIISVHSFRGGTGKSNTTANVASLLALRGYRVGVVDTDIQSPGIHVLFRMEEGDIHYSLNDYLWGKCGIHEAAHNVSHILNGNVNNGSLFLIPSSIKTNEIARILREGYDPAALSDGYNDLLDEMEFDYLIIDTHPGLNEETLLSIAMSDILVVIMRPDSQDYQGTGVTIEVARKLGAKKLMLAVNKVPQSFELEGVKTRIEQAYQCPVAAIFPHSDDLMSLASSDVFSIQNPSHPLTSLYEGLVDQIIG